MKIAINGTCLCMRMSCDICELPFELEGMQACVMDADGQRGDLVCRDCIAAGPDGIKRRAQEAANQMKEIAADAQRFADELSQEDIEMPSLAAYDLEQERVYVDRFGMTREQLEMIPRDDGGF